MFSTPNFRTAFLLLLALIGLSWWSIYLVRAPQAKPVTAPLTDFSAGRAMQYVRQITRQPHSIGTPDHARVRAYLVNTLRVLGLQPQVQEATVTGPVTSSASLSPSGARLGVALRAGYVYNVMARLKGTQPGKAVLLMAHYDSQPNALGAGDDGAGVAAILETIRAIQQGTPLQHDIIVLFTDGEEYGLFGAKAFLRHPWAKDVGFVLNLEGRGNSGPSMTFEISPQNGWIVEQFAKAAPHPFASSLAYEVYRKLPNDTDFTIFREAGYPGLNSAFLDGFVHYHKLTDSPENLSQNSLQHHGDNLLALTRHFGNSPLDQVKAPDKVFFNLVGDWMVQYPMALNWLWISLLTVAFVVVFVWGFRQKQLTVGQVIGGLVLYLVILLLVVSFAWGVNVFIHQQLPLTHVFNGSYGSATFALAFTLLAVGLLGLLTNLVLRWLRPLSLIMGAYGLMYGLVLTCFFLLPSATYLLLFPLLSALIGLLAVLWQTRNQVESRPVHALILGIAALPTLFILLPIVNLLFVTFDLQLPMAPVLLFGLAFALLLPLWVLIVTSAKAVRWRWRNQPIGPALLPFASLVLGAVLVFTAIYNEAPTTEKPLHSQVSYYLNTDTNRAFWASYGLETIDDWNRQFFPAPSTGKLTEIFPDVQGISRGTYLENPAAVITASPPVADVLSDVTTDTIRRLTLDLHSVRGAANMDATMFTQAAGIVKSIQVNGEPIAIEAQQTSIGLAFDLLFFGLPVTKKITLTVELVAGIPLRLLLYDQSIGLPPELVKIPRPAHVIPEQGRSSNLTFIGKAYQF
jgi:hypothetical protein